MNHEQSALSSMLQTASCSLFQDSFDADDVTRDFLVFLDGEGALDETGVGYVRAAAEFSGVHLGSGI